jgi:hypothetical protein
MGKVYLETSFFSVCVSTRSGIKGLGWKASSNEWWQAQARRHELFISPEVIRELAAPEFPNRSSALQMVRGLSMLDLTPEVTELAELLVEEKVMPGPATQGDAIHVAAATFHGMDYILTWNVKHLANPNKRKHFAIICVRLGLAPPILMTPDLLQENEDE